MNMKRESGLKKFPIWLIGDSNPKNWENDLDCPLDPRHPARHNIWTPILDGIQERVFLADRRRVNTAQLYVRNAVQSTRDKPLGKDIIWQPKLRKETCDLGNDLTSYTPKVVFAFGAFAFEFTRLSLKKNQERKFKYWTTKELGQEFTRRVEAFDPDKINIFPLLHVSIARGKFLKSHDYFTDGNGGNYFDYAAKEIAFLLLKHKDKLPIWIG